jgi:hypothetical protein
MINLPVECLPVMDFLEILLVGQTCLLLPRTIDLQPPILSFEEETVEDGPAAANSSSACYLPHSLQIAWMSLHPRGK